MIVGKVCDLDHARLTSFCYQLIALKIKAAKSIPQTQATSDI